ncbi:MAG: nucleoside-diphosphate-sugar epimerase [Patiriisocius sp.]
MIGIHFRRFLITYSVTEITIFAKTSRDNSKDLGKMESKILVIGAAGQIGIELVKKLRDLNGYANVFASDLRCTDAYISDSNFIQLDVLDKPALRDLFIENSFTEVYLLAAMLSATGEKYPINAWDLNMQSLLNILELGKDKLVNKIFWPSSIAVFGTESPKFNTPQHSIKNPNTVYGISKLAGEQWCDYYHTKYDVDVRSLRYPGLIGHESEPGGGTTDYAVSIFHEALENNSFTCYLHKDRALPMMYMDDAIRSTIEIMEADPESIKHRDSYNLAGISFSPEQLALEIKKHLPNFKMDYLIDSRDHIASTWPSSIDDSVAKEEWNWNPTYNLESMVEDMIFNLKKKRSSRAVVS